MNSETAIAERQVRLGAWVFLASELMFFGPVFLGFGVGHYALSAGFQEASKATHWGLGTANTVILLTSSASIAMAVAWGNAGMARRARHAIDATLAFGLAFLVLKAIEYRMDWQEDLIPGAGFLWSGVQDPRSAELFYTLYFFSTLLHSVHLIIGLGLLAVCRLQFVGPRRNPRRLEGYALYWHFVDLIWIFLFPLLYLTGRAS